MMVSVYSFITSTIFSSVFILVCEILRRKNGFLLHYNVNLLLCMIGASVFRICIPIEMPNTMVIRSETIFPAIQQFLRSTIPIYNTEISVHTLILFIWGMGSVVYVAQLIMRVIHDKKALELLTLTHIENNKVALCTEKVITKANPKIKVIISPQIRTPMVTGLFIPTILLPQMITEFSEERVKYILTHEWYHILNKDLWVKWLVQLLCCIMWWNPVVYLLKNNLEQVLEIRCDHRVTQKMDKKEKLNYLQTILLVSQQFLVTESKIKQPQLVASFAYIHISDDSLIKQRFHVVSKYKSTQKSRYIGCIMAMFLLFTLSYTIVLQPFNTEGPPMEDIMGVDEITPENTYILIKNDGTHSLVSGKSSYEILEEELSQEQYNILPKIYE